MEKVTSLKLKHFLNTTYTYCKNLIYIRHLCANSVLMNRKLLLSISALLLTLTATAQLNYTITTHTDTYKPLTGATSVNDTIIWDDQVFAMPLGFNFDMDGQVNDSIYISRDNLLAIDSAGTVNLFVLTDIDLLDRGNINDTETRSPMRYQLTGTAPNRIFKFEIANAGLSAEFNTHGTNNDSLNIQAWFYETSNVVELRYGPSKISHPSDYHYLSAGKALNGYIKNFNLNSFIIQMGYFLDGNPAAPTVDSAADLFSIGGGLDTYPPNGTMYRFTPKPVSINDNAGALTKLQLLSNTGTTQLLLRSDYNEAMTFKIVAINGTTLYDNGVVKRGVNRIDITNLPLGMHILHVAGKDGMQAYRINKF